MRNGNADSRTRGPRPLAAAALLVLSGLALLSGTGWADGRKLEVIAESAPVFLDPDPRSPVVETLVRGSIVTLASNMKMKANWFYVQFVSFQSGRTRSGYIFEGAVRKLFPTLKVVHISSEDEISDPKSINLESGYFPNLEWGTTRASILRTEGRPQGQQSAQGLEVLRYRREILNKKCLVEYVLSQDRLVTARFHLLENYADKNRYIKDYDRVRAFLTARVGEPRSDKVVWQDHTYENENELWGRALSLGQLAFSSEWVFRDTAVHIVLAGGNDRVTFGAEINDVKAKTPASF